MLAEVSGLPSDAACVRPLAGMGPVHAPRLLERGRGLVMEPAIDGRGDASTLKGINPDLNGELEWLQVPLAGSNTKVPASSQGGSNWVTETKK